MPPLWKTSLRYAFSSLCPPGQHPCYSARRCSLCGTVNIPHFLPCPTPCFSASLASCFRSLQSVKSYVCISCQCGMEAALFTGRLVTEQPFRDQPLSGGLTADRAACGAMSGDDLAGSGPQDQPHPGRRHHDFSIQISGQMIDRDFGKSAGDAGLDQGIAARTKARQVQMQRPG